MATPGDLAPAIGERLRLRTRDISLDKRLLDICGALVGLILLAPVFTAIALLIAFDSKGSPIYRQRRLGLRGKPFEMYKFRTMRADNDPELHREYVTQLILEGGDGLENTTGAFKLEHDPRVTRMGAFLRRMSVDEFPQLLNVLRGEMSLVGPRPPLDYEYELYTARQRRRLDTVPGMTGLWQVSGRNETTFEEMIDLDLEYIRSRTLATDLVILVKTVGVVLEAKAA